MTNSDLNIDIVEKAIFCSSEEDYDCLLEMHSKEKMIQSEDFIINYWKSIVAERKNYKEYRVYKYDLNENDFERKLHVNEAAGDVIYIIELYNDKELKLYPMMVYNNKIQFLMER